MLSDNKEFLKFGDCIYLYSKTAIVLDKSKRSVLQNEIYKDFPYVQGYLSAKGFFDDQVYFQRTSIGLSLDEKDHANLLNSRDNLFVIVPRLKYDFHLEYEKAQEDLAITMKQFKILSEEEKDRHKSTVAKYESRVERAKLRAKKEAQDNETFMAKEFGKEAKYEMEVHLMHFDSKMFVCSVDLCSDTSQIGYKVIMTRFFQEGMKFKINSKFKSRGAGDLIQYGDEVLLRNLKTGYDLSISDIDYEPPKDLSVEETNPMLPKQNVFDPNTSKHQIFLGDGEYNTWKILVHSSYDVKGRLGSKIFGHNLIRLFHAETGSYLCAGPSFQGSVPEVVLKRYYGENEEEFKSVR